MLTKTITKNREFLVLWRS